MINSKNIVILAPMDCECEYLISQLTDIRQTCALGFIFYEGQLNGVFIVIVRCLVGTVNAALSTMLAIEKYSPCCVILQGTSGSHDIALRTNDIVVANKTVSLVHTMSPKKQEKQGSSPYEWESFGIQAYQKKLNTTDYLDYFECDAKLVELAEKVDYKNGRVAVGAVGCADIWNREADLIMHYHKTKNTLCEAMEGVSVAQVCAAYDVPMIEIRVISNNELVEDESFSEDSAVNCQKFVCDYVSIVNENLNSL